MKIRLISDQGSQLGIYSYEDAQQKAEEIGLDLMEVAPLAQPPVYKMIDYGKFKYEQKKKAQEAHKHQAVVVVKEVKLRPSIGRHDLDTKRSQVKTFLDKKYRVKVLVEIKRNPQLGMDLLKSFMESLGKFDDIQKEGKNYCVTL